MNRVYQVAIIILAIAVVYLLWEKSVGVQAQPTAVMPKDVAKYPFLAPRILQEYHNDILISFLPLRQELRKISEPYGDTFAMYFEYLPTGTSIGINEKAEFSLASLIKLPVVMAYYHMRERTGVTDDPEVEITPEDIDKKYGTLWAKGVGSKIRLSEAVRLALVESDNTAIRIVGRHVPDEDFEAVYDGLDIDLKMGDVGAVITAKHFSSILKALYFASVLNKDHSQEILNIMTKSRFTDKIPAGVGDNVPVAHKIGVLGTALYSDCGIVFVPKRTYLLCIVENTNEAEATQHITTVSKAVYDFISTVNK
jgi:beta-lactamase class A